MAVVLGTIGAFRPDALDEGAARTASLSLFFFFLSTHVFTHSLRFGIA